MLKAKITPPEKAHLHKRMEDENQIVLNYLTIRKIVGWLGILLPIILALACLLYPGCDIIQPSISDYHNTLSRDVFVGLLCAISLFLFSYKGYEPLDNWLANIVGILGFVVAFFPTYIKKNCCTIYPHRAWDHVDLYEFDEWVGLVHLSSAAVFLTLLGVYSWVLFTRSDKEENKRSSRKPRRNKVYRSCAFVIWVCVSLLIIYFLSGFSNEERDTKYKIIIILECIALWAFGFSWLVKGKTMGLIKFLQDKPEE